MDGNALESIPILAALPPKVRRGLIEESRRRTFHAGDVLVAEGAAPLDLFLIAAGHARIERSGAGRVGRFGPGDFFGELALFDDSPRTATVTAEDDVEVLLIPAWTFRALLRQYPAIAVPMLEKVIRQLHGR